MKKAIFCTILFLLPFLCNAVHLVGGEFELVHLDGLRYRLTLVTYFDELNGLNPGPETSVTVTVFANRDHASLATFQLGLTESIPLDFSNLNCAIAELQITQAKYSAIVAFSPEDFADPAGYYAVWERCCRPAGVVNVVNSEGSGTTFTMDFPPVTTEDGIRFINSSPVFALPFSDYACVGRLTEIDLQVSDPDGDSLSYRIVTPFNSTDTSPIPTPSPRTEHLPVILAEGIDESNLIPGNPDLFVTRDGILTVNPSNPGSYAYAVEVTEYRAGEAIGKVIREFQLLVIDGCLPEVPPVNYVSKPGGDFNTAENISLDFSDDAEFCFLWAIGDDNRSSGTRELLPVNFSMEKLSQIMVTQVAAFNDSSVYEVCLPDCAFRAGEPLVFDLMSTVEDCPMPSTGTLRISALLPEEPNNAPSFVISDVTRTIDVDQRFFLELRAIDEDQDEMTMSLFNPNQISLEDLEISLVELGNAPGEIRTDFQWEPDCDLLERIGEDPFSIGVVVQDVKDCSVGLDTLMVHLNLNGDERPQISAFENSDSLLVTLAVDEVFSRTFSGVEPEGSTVTADLINVDSDGPDLAALGVSFEVSQATGEDDFSVTVDWTPTCSVFAFGEEEDVEMGAITFGLALSVNDENLCDIVRQPQYLIFTVEGTCTITEVPGMLFSQATVEKVDESGVVLRDLREDATVKIFDLTGRQYAQGRVLLADGTSRITANLVRNRVYLLQMGNETTKLFFQ